MKLENISIGEKRRMLDNWLDKLTEYSDIITESENFLSDIPHKISSLLGGVFKK